MPIRRCTASPSDHLSDPNVLLIELVMGLLTVAYFRLQHASPLPDSCLLDHGHPERWRSSRAHRIPPEAASCTPSSSFSHSCIADERRPKQMQLESKSKRSLPLNAACR